MLVAYSWLQQFCGFAMVKDKPNSTRIYDEEGYRKRAACVCVKDSDQSQVLTRCHRISLTGIVAGWCLNHVYFFSQFASSSSSHWLVIHSFFATPVHVNTSSVNYVTAWLNLKLPARRNNTLLIFFSSSFGRYFWLLLPVIKKDGLYLVVDWSPMKSHQRLQ